MRLWPQTYDTEGFFCAVLRKTAPTRAVERMEWKHFQERPLLRHKQAEILAALADRYGTTFLRERELLCEREDHIILATEEVMQTGVPAVDYSLGLPFAKGLKKSAHVRLTSDLVMLRGAEASKRVWEIDDAILGDLMSGRDPLCPAALDGDTILLYRGMAVGSGLARDGRLKNNLPRWMVGLRS